MVSHMQTGQGVLTALNPNSTASMVKYGTSASSLTSTMTGTSEVTRRPPLLYYAADRQSCHTTSTAEDLVSSDVCGSTSVMVHMLCMCWSANMHVSLKPCKTASFHLHCNIHFRVPVLAIVTKRHHSADCTSLFGRAGLQPDLQPDRSRQRWFNLPELHLTSAAHRGADQPHPRHPVLLPGWRRHNLQLHLQLHRLGCSK